VIKNSTIDFFSHEGRCANYRKIYLGNDANFLVKFGGTPLPPYKNEVGHVAEFSSGIRAVSNGTKMLTIGLSVFEKFRGKGFPFQPLAAEWRTAGGANSAVV